MTPMLTECQTDNGKGGENMEYLGFIMLLVGVAGMDSHIIISGLTAIIGLTIIAIKSTKLTHHKGRKS